MINKLTIAAACVLAAASMCFADSSNPDKVADHAVVRGAPAGSVDPARASITEELARAKEKGETARVAELENRLRPSSTPVPLASGEQVEGIKVIHWYDLPPEDRPAPGPLWTDGDILVHGSEFFDVSPAMASDSEGRLFCAFQKEDTSGTIIRVHWSQDGGQTWAWWSETWSPVGHDLISPTVAVGEGSGLNYVFHAFIETGTERLIVWRDQIDGTDSRAFAIETNPAGICNPQLVTDAAEYAAWYPYIVYNTQGPDAWLLRFSRSTDYGATWTPPVAIHAYSNAPGPIYNGYDGYPDVEFGSGYLYACFDDYPAGGDGSQRDVFIMESSSFGGSWSAGTAIATSALDEFAPRLAAVKSYSAARTVLAGYTKYYGGMDYDIWYAYTVDGGGTWNTNYCLACASDKLEGICDLATSYGRGLIHMAFFLDGTVAYTCAPYDSPSSWEPYLYASDDGVACITWPRPAVAVDPTKAPTEEAGVAWTDERAYDRQIYFDGPGVADAGVEAGGHASQDVAAPRCDPNPLTTSATICFTLNGPAPVKVGIYDAGGRLVRQLMDADRARPGEHHLTWDGRDAAGQAAGPGVYFVRVTTPGGSSRSKVVVVR